MNNIPNLMDRPDLVLFGILLFFLLLIVVLTVIAVAVPGVANRQMIKEVLDNPAIQERLKTQPFDVAELLRTCFQSLENNKPHAGLVGLLEKINRDITWDVAGLIGIIVTFVLMVMIVTQKTENIPKEIIAGWTMILGFYFGKAVK